MIRTRKRLATLIAGGVVSIGLAAPAAAPAQPVVTGGLVNVTLSDVVDVNNNQVIAQVPIGVAANICGVNAAVLAQGRQDTDPVCTATNDQLPRAFQAR